MAKFKLKLGALPDFKLPVKFQMINGDEAEVIFTAKHRKAKEIQEVFHTEGLKDFDFVKEICSGWNLEEEFNDENIEELVSLFPASVLALTNAYMQALAGQRAKN